MKKFLLQFFFSKKEITIIHDALEDKKYSCLISKGESCQDTVEDINVLLKKLPNGFSFLYDL